MTARITIALITVTCGDATPPKSTCGVPQHRQSSMDVVNSTTSPPAGEPNRGANVKTSVVCA
ncbi:MAG TPA: hypothetical protein VGA10_11010 [Thermoanaerobaculia bacterium]